MGGGGRRPAWRGARGRRCEMFCLLAVEAEVGRRGKGPSGGHSGRGRTGLMGGAAVGGTGVHQGAGGLMGVPPPWGCGTAGKRPRWPRSDGPGGTRLAAREGDEDKVGGELQRLPPPGRMQKRRRVQERAPGPSRPLCLRGMAVPQRGKPSSGDATGRTDGREEGAAACCRGCSMAAARGDGGVATRQTPWAAIRPAAGSGGVEVVSDVAYQTRSPADDGSLPLPYLLFPHLKTRSPTAAPSPLSTLPTSQDKKPHRRRRAPSPRRTLPTSQDKKPRRRRLPASPLSALPTSLPLFTNAHPLPILHTHPQPP